MAGNDRRSLQRNAADPKQVKYAARKEKQAEERLQTALIAVLSTYEGRLVWAEFFEGAGIYESSFDHSGSTMYFREGRRNQGLEWQARLIAADETLFEMLERERRARRRALDNETAAVQAEATTEESNG